VSSARGGFPDRFVDLTPSALAHDLGVARADRKVSFHSSLDADTANFRLLAASFDRARG